jgi:PAS domain S-box-containing protein/putative nucleotidyltransferase with HDIG domain
MTRTNRRSREAGQSAAATADGGRASGAHDSPVTAGGRASIVEALRHSERRYRSLFDNLLNGYAHCRMILDEQGRPVDFVYQDVNAAFERLTGLKDVVGKPVSETIPGLREASPQLFASYARVAASGEPETFEVEIESLGMWLFISAYGTEPGYFDAVFENITERKRAEKELRESQGQLREAHRLAHIGVWNWTAATDTVIWTDELYRIAGLDPTLPAPTYAQHPNVYAPESWGRLKTAVERALETGEPYQLELELVRPDDTTRWVHAFGGAAYEDHGLIEGLYGTVQDITERKLAEERLAAVAGQWRQTFDAMRDSVAVFDRDARLLSCNAATTTLTGRGFDDIVGRPCYEVFHGMDAYHSDCPQRRALESGQVETSFMEQDGRWLRVTFAPEVDAAGQVVGGVHVVTDVSELKHSELQLLESVTRQQSITEGVIAALARTVDERDPYTAGHQRRVSELAAAIARHMGLDEEKVRGVQIAGMLHDVGKITIPAEILSKPGRLSAIELELVKSHPQAAHDILESIEFDLPIADVAMQHHERLDGSGYPSGLMGEAILPEARILAVADVVEAMISHRPYRAALPLEAAMEEIEDGAGSRYDAAACDAATRLFREQGFAFAE